MPNPTIPNFPPQGIQAQLDLLYLYNPDAANKLIEQLNAGLADMEAFKKELEKALQDLQGVLRYKGSVETREDLPAEGNVVGDVWNIISTDENVAWDGTKWDKFGSAIDPSAFVTSVNTKKGDVVLTGADINATLTGTGDPVTATVTEHIQTLKNDETELGNQVSGIQALIPSDASETNLLSTAAALMPLTFAAGNVPYTTFNPATPNQGQDFYANILFQLPESPDGTYCFFSKSLNQGPHFAVWYVEVTIKDGQLSIEEGKSIAAFLPSINSTPTYTNGIVAEAENSLVARVVDGKLQVRSQNRGPLGSTYWNEPFPTEWLKVSALYKKDTFTLVSQPEMGTNEWFDGTFIRAANPYITNLSNVLTQFTYELSVPQNNYICITLAQLGPELNSDPSKSTQTIALMVDADNYLFAELTATDRWIWRVLAAKGVFKTAEAAIYGDRVWNRNLYIGPFSQELAIYATLGIYPLRSYPAGLSLYSDSTHPDESTKQVLTPEPIAGGLPDQTGHTGFLQTDGTNATWSDKRAVVNSAIYSSNIVIGRDANDRAGQGNQVTIGNNAASTGAGNVTIGPSATNKGYDGSVVLGRYAQITGVGGYGQKQAIAIGHYAIVDKVVAIQIGYGTNSIANTVQFYNYRILNANGTIPSERLAADGTTGQVLSKTDTGMQWVDMGGASAIVHDATLAGTGTTEDPLKVADNTYLPLDGGKLTGPLVAPQLSSGEFSSTNVLGIRADYVKDGNLTEGQPIYITAEPSGHTLSISGNLIAKDIMPKDLNKNLGSIVSPWARVYTKKLNNGADLAVPTTGGTLARLEDLPTVTDNTNGTKIIQIGKTVIVTGTDSVGSVGPGIATEHPITLPVTMANNTYVVSLTPTCTGGFAQLNVDYEEETTTGFNVGLRNIGSTASSDVKIGWMVIGDIAE